MEKQKTERDPWEKRGRADHSELRLRPHCQLLGRSSGDFEVHNLMPSEFWHPAEPTYRFRSDGMLA